LVAETVDSFTGKFIPTYDWNDSVTNKIETIATKIYGATNVEYSSQAKADLKRISSLGLDALPICMAKTQKSLSDNPDLLGRPRGFTLHVREIEVAAGDWSGLRASVLCAEAEPFVHKAHFGLHAPRQETFASAKQKPGVAQPQESALKLVILCHSVLPDFPGYELHGALQF